MERKIIIVYKSATGFTKKYAEWIAREAGCDLMDFRHADAGRLSAYDVVVFGSRLRAGSLDGLKKMKALYAASGAQQLALFATGAMPNAAKDAIENMWKNNLEPAEMARIPHFYMQAGLNYERMPAAERFVMKLLSAVMRRRKNKTPEEEGFARAIEKSFDICDERYVLPLAEYLKNA